MEFKELIARRKCVYVSDDSLMEYFGNWQHHDHVMLYEFPECAGATIIDVTYDWQRRMFGVTMVREDWPELAPGTIPDIEFTKQRLVKIKTEALL